MALWGNRLKSYLSNFHTTDLVLGESQLIKVSGGVRKEPKIQFLDDGVKTVGGKWRHSRRDHLTRCFTWLKYSHKLYTVNTRLNKSKQVMQECLPIFFQCRQEGADLSSGGSLFRSFRATRVLFEGQ